MGGAATGPVRPKLVINGIVRPAATCGLSSEDRADAIDLAIPLMATEPPSQHIGTMQKTHPHAEATYRVIAFDDGSFGVKVEIPETYPTTVSKFATEANAAAWITEDQRRVQSQTRRATDFRPAKPLS